MNAQLTLFPQRAEPIAPPMFEPSGYLKERPANERVKESKEFYETLVKKIPLFHATKVGKPSFSLYQDGNGFGGGFVLYGKSGVHVQVIITDAGAHAYFWGRWTPSKKHLEIIRVFGYTNIFETSAGFPKEENLENLIEQVRYFLNVGKLA